MIPLKIYLDQNVYGHLLDREPWQDHPIAQTLLQAQGRGAAEIWASPTHLLELAQASDLDRRQKLAQVMLAMCESRRMTAGPQFVLVNEFGTFINDLVPGSFNGDLYLAKYSFLAQQLHLGFLGLLAGPHTVQLGPGLAEVRRAKLESQLMHARIGADPDTVIAAIIKNVADSTLTTDMDPLGLAALTDEQIVAEVDTLRLQQRAASRQTITKLQKHRAEVCAAYGAVDIGGAIRGIFGQFPFDLHLTFSAPALIAGWASVQKRYKAPPLPKDILDAPPERQFADQKLIVRVLNEAIKVAISAKLAVASAGYYSLVKELEICMNQKRLPTPGATLDVEHATSAVLFDIIVCHDELLANNLKSYVGSIQSKTTVVSTERQLSKAIAAGATGV